MFKHFVKIIAVSAITAPCFAASVQPAVALANEIGIAPESLVLCTIASGTCGNASSVLNRIDQATELAAAIATTRTAVDQAGQQVTVMATQVQIAGDDELVVAAYQHALSDLDTARAAYVAAQQALRDEALDGVDSAKVAKLEAWKSAATRNVPAEFRVLELTDEQWHAVERALRAERRADRLGETLDSGHAQLLAEIRSDTAVVNAQYLLAQHLSGVDQVFSQFSGE